MRRSFTIISTIVASLVWFLAGMEWEKHRVPTAPLVIFQQESPIVWMPEPSHCFYGNVQMYNNKTTWSDQFSNCAGPIIPCPNPYKGQQ